MEVDRLVNGIGGITLLNQLILAGVALGVASVLVYRSAQRTLKDKEKATAQFIDAKFNRRQDEERRRLDDALLERSLALAGQNDDHQ